MGYTITAKDWGRYRDTLKRISDKAAEEMQKYAQAHGFQIDEAMVDYAYSLSTKYGQAAGALASQLYDEMANYWMEVNSGKTPYAKAGNFIKPAEIADTATREEVEAALRSATNEPTSIPSRVGRMVKLAGADTTVKNAIRDHAQWAWIPNGDTCPFCLILASQGWVNASKKVLKGNHCEHIHANCDCTFAIRFDGSTNVEGYDPEKYLSIYREHNGDLNAIRRLQYPSIADARNAKRRELYSQRKKQLIESGAKKTIVWKDRHAERYYEEIRNRKPYSDANHIAKNVDDFSIDEIEEIRQYMFVDKHYRNGTFERFDADYDQAEAWQRLVDGKSIRESDIIMLKHELLEKSIIGETHCTYEEAHEKANSVYNWWSAVLKEMGSK